MIFFVNRKQYIKLTITSMNVSRGEYNPSPSLRACFINNKLILALKSLSAWSVQNDLNINTTLNVSNNKFLAAIQFT